MADFERDRAHGTKSTNYIDVSVSSSAEIIDSLSRLEDDNQKETFGCQQCSKVFNRRENLSRHLKTHDASPSHCCSKCGKGFTRSDLLRRHQAGHERWDNQDSKRRQTSGKKRKVDVQGSMTSESAGNSSWTNSTESSGMSRPYGSAYRAVRDAFAIQRPMANSAISSPGFTDPNPQTYQAMQESHYESILNSDPEHHDMFPQVHTNMPVRPHPLDTFSNDFSSFLLPPEVNQFSQEWFSYDFYSAMQEVGNEWGGLGVLLDPNMLTPGHEYSNVDTSNYQELDAEGSKSKESSQGRISRVSSPPNEASEEDKWPFQWNPNSRQILKAQPIHIPNDHPLFQNHYSRYDITEATLLRLQYFLQPPAGREFHKSQKGSFVLPSLPIINVFIRLFFENFSPHMPVLHHPTVNTNADLPPPLLAAIVIIGAIYSNVKHTRRFSIVLLDIIRWHLRIAIECDNSLMRDPMIIYAEALICHTGIWGGNKRAFELAEVVRGGLVTYIRRVRFGDQLMKTPEQDIRGNLQEEWKRWITEESQRRLAWAVYGIDSYFPSILNLPPTISMGEVRNLVCPCDEEFWAATSARNWKNLLGPASVPPSRSFSAAVGPFVLPGHGRLPAINLNPWSAFLVLQSMTHQIFQFSLDSMVARTFMDDDPCGDDTMYPPGDPNNFLRKLHAERHAQLAESLDAWATSYLTRSQPHFHPASKHFHACSVVIHHLSTILLDVPLSDLQNAIGKDGIGGIVQAMTNLSNWARRSPHIADQAAYNATKTIVSLAPSNNLSDDGVRNVDTAPYSLIALFLCHIVLWAYATVAPREQKMRLLHSVMQHPALRISAFVVLLKRALGLDGQEEDGEPKLLFRSAAEMLTRLGTWGGSLNLALLLHRRAEM
ncbi:uncharacterized protein LY89DRAFT_586564 [Mollisia scopiformis]|uniref:C2H2-type domain-containing protein n=1 Tax=Mollisia scopiformis TaxID=149040 RepID=A0A194XA45_MOLSC|nr:uncharacterized protein LY89DRAFT_586564 [Mollisia scopiformis]KUJ16637.1 hypothetical protein LY89DRAFT_586564 [Mollisia scopiformis]